MIAELVYGNHHNPLHLSIFYSLEMCAGKKRMIASSCSITTGDSVVNKNNKKEVTQDEYQLQHHTEKQNPWNFS